MIIELNDVSVIRDSKYLLKDIDWTIKEGEHWAVLGLNGAGKTILLNLLTGYIFPSKGSLSVLGKTVGKYDMRKLRKSIGIVSSSIIERLHDYSTAMDIVLSGKFATMDLFDETTENDRVYARNCLEKLDAIELSDREYRTFSQGEKQRVLIARSLMAKPELLILDEPCTGLDLIAREQLLSIIRNLSESKNAPTLIYVTHHTEEILPNFTHTLLLRKGELHLTGFTDKVLTEEHLSDFYETPIIYEKSGDRILLHLDYDKRKE
ncbi:MAG TPA: ATP-binding cassette domain-containing protein [Tissierellaceae bacterium]|nr:ATP-binding cassette domain-containing protein [Tissierellaceae bacterium]